MSKVYTFSTEILGDVTSRETFPIFDDECQQLLGAFTLNVGNFIQGFISGSNHPVAICVSTGGHFFFTPKDGNDGKIASGIVSDVAISPLSVRVRAK